MKHLLSHRQQRFVDRYLIHLDSTRAAQEAGYRAGSARNQAHRMMKNDDIRNAIDTAIEARSERTQITQDRVLKELAVIAFARISDFADWTDQELTIKRSDEISPELTSAIKSLIIQADRQSSRKSIALHDKLQCLELLGRHLGMFNGGSSNSQESRPELLQRLSDYFKKKSGAPDAANSK